MGSKRGAILGLVAAGTLAGCGTDFEKKEITSRFGVDCTNGENIEMTDASIVKSGHETSKGKPDKGSFKLRFYCEAGRIMISELVDKVGPKGQKPFDNIVEITTEDLSGKQTNGDTLVATASHQQVGVNVQTGNNFGEITFTNADTMVQGAIIPIDGRTRQLDFGSIQQ